jgi:REP element-mobilizing transposase RayT
MGRKYEHRRNLPHIQKDDRAHFITFNTHQKWILPPAARDIVLSSCLFLDGKKIELHAAVIMPEHVHMIFSVLRSSDGENFTFAEILGPVKGIHCTRDQQGDEETGTVWQDESFDHVLRSEEKLDDKIEYLRQNPVRRGLVKRPEDYKWLWGEKYSE